MLVEEIEAQLSNARADLDAAGEAWLEAKAAGNLLQTQREEAILREAESAVRRLERKLHRKQKANRRSTA